MTYKACVKYEKTDQENGNKNTLLNISLFQAFVCHNITDALPSIIALLKGVNPPFDTVTMLVGQ